MNEETNVIGIEFDPMQIEHISQLFGHELALSLKNAMQEESLTVDVNLECEELHDIAFQFDRIATVLEKLGEKL